MSMNQVKKTSALQRIAKATEAMAVNFVRLQNDYNGMRESRDEYQVCYERQKKMTAELKKENTRLKRLLIKINRTVK